MTVKVKNRLVQARLDEDDLHALEQVKKILHVDENSSAIRLMIEDEVLAQIAANARSDKKKFDAILDIVSKINRTPLLQAVMGLSSDEGAKKINNLQLTYDDINNKLSSLMWTANNISNNVNQLAHSVNLACKEDPANEQAWQWVIENLRVIVNASTTLQSFVKTCKSGIKSRQMTA